MSDKRYIPNTLSKPNFSERNTLQEALQHLQSLVEKGINLLEESFADEGKNSLSDGHDSVYSGRAGIALMYIRLSQQLYALKLSQNTCSNMASLAKAHMPRLHHHDPHIGRISPFGSTLGPSVVEIFRQVLLEVSHPNTKENKENWAKALYNLRRAVGLASRENEGESNEMLYGRAGLLYTMIHLRHLSMHATDFDKLKLSDLHHIVATSAIKDIAKIIIKEGERGAKLYSTNYGPIECPLMWEWHDKAYLGAIHGVAGILTILLQTPKGTLSDSDLSQIVKTASFLESLTSKDGNLPSSLPAKNRSHPHVQICHGAPGLMLLRTAFKRMYPELENHISQSIKVADAVWEQALVKKGLGICHGIAGNAWPWLLDVSSTSDVNVESLSRAIALLTCAETCPPIGDNRQFRLPDRPFSLFEGLAGTICAWADGAATLYNQLNPDSSVPILGYVGIGPGAIGVL